MKMLFAHTTQWLLMTAMLFVWNSASRADESTGRENSLEQRVEFFEKELRLDRFRRELRRELELSDEQTAQLNEIVAEFVESLAKKKDVGDALQEWRDALEAEFGAEYAGQIAARLEADGERDDHVEDEKRGQEGGNHHEGADAALEEIEFSAEHAEAISEAMEEWSEHFAEALEAHAEEFEEHVEALGEKVEEWSEQFSEGWEEWAQDHEGEWEDWAEQYEAKWEEWRKNWSNPMPRKNCMKSFVGTSSN